MDFITANFMRSGIESAIARGARQSAAASHHVAERVDLMSNAVTGKIAHLRTDMLEGMDGVRDGIEAMGTQVSKGLYALNLQARHTHDELRSMGMTLTTLSSNVVTGFKLVLNALETVQGTLDEIKTGVLNPEETKSLERYRTARLLAEKGRPQDALRYASSAIENPGGLPMLHVPELRALRGMIYMGLHDTTEQSVMDPHKAVEELREAIVFARPQAQGMLKDHLGMTLFGIGDYQGALSVYEDLRAHKGYGHLSRFQTGRCYLAMSMTDHARDVFKDLTAANMSMSLVCAADSLCAEHTDMFKEIFRRYREKAIDEIKDVASLLPATHDLLRQRGFVSDAVNATLNALQNASDGLNKTPLGADLQKACQNALKGVKCTPSVYIRALKPSILDPNFTLMSKSIQDFDEQCGAGAFLGYDVATPDHQSDWSDVAKYVRAMRLSIQERSAAYSSFLNALEVGSALISRTGMFDVDRRPLVQVEVSTRFDDRTVHAMRNPKKPGLLASMSAEGKQAIADYKRFLRHPREYEWAEQRRLSDLAEGAVARERRALELQLNKDVDAITQPLVQPVEQIKAEIYAAQETLSILEYRLRSFEQQYEFCLKEISAEDDPEADAPSF